MSDIRDLVDCKNNKFLTNLEVSDPDMINSELAASDYDIGSSKRDFSFDDFKWATIKAYYSMLHSAKAVAISRKLKIEHHKCVSLFVMKLADHKEIESRYAYGFRSIYDSRIKADYGLSYSKEVAAEAIDIAEKFNPLMRALIK